MSYTLSSIILELENLEKDINLLLNLTNDSSESSLTLTTLTLDSINEKVENLVSYFSIFMSKANLLDSKEDGIKGKDILNKLQCLFLLKVIYKVVLNNNPNMQVLVPTLDKLDNKDSGIIQKIKNISLLVDKI